MWSKIGLLAGTVGAAAFATSHVARAESETTAALYEKAKADGGLSIYGGGPIRQYEPWAKEFEQVEGLAICLCRHMHSGRPELPATNHTTW